MSTPARAATPACDEDDGEGRPPDVIDIDGPWWEVAGFEHWWIREGADGACVAKHRGGRLPTVHAPNVTLLGVFTQHEQMDAAHTAWYSPRRADARPA